MITIVQVNYRTIIMGVVFNIPQNLKHIKLLIKFSEE